MDLEFNTIVNELRSEQTELRNKLKKVERTYKNQRIIILTGLMLFVAIIMVGFTNSDKPIETQSLLIKDAHGKTRISLGVEDDRAIISLVNSSGKTSVRLATSGEKHSNGLTLLDDKDVVRASLLVQKNGKPAMLLSDASGFSQTGLIERPNGQPLLSLRSSEK